MRKVLCTYLEKKVQTRDSAIVSTLHRELHGEDPIRAKWTPTEWTPCKWISASWTLRTDVLVGNKLGGLAPRSAIAPAFAGLDGQGKRGATPH